jgi:hypothetical protein
MQLPAAGLALALLLPFSGAAESISIKLQGDAFKVAGWPVSVPPPGGWASVFAVYAGDPGVPPMLGSYTVEAGALTFRPRFPIAPGVHVRAVFTPPGGAPVKAEFQTPKAKLGASTRVEYIYPSIDLLPSNQLKFYVHFTAPMSRGEAWQHIRLLDRKGDPVDLPFLEIDQELWDREYKRLTVLFDPGRIKRGVLPLEEVGPAIEEGGQYTLVIDRDWRDARGATLQNEFRKTFHVGPAERAPLDPSRWELITPKAGISDPLILNLPKPMDAALLRRLLEVSLGHDRIDGTVTLDRMETQWRFIPAQPWKPGNYELVIDTALEDLAGNRIGRAFDVDVFDTITQQVSQKTTSLSFRIRDE